MMSLPGEHSRLSSRTASNTSRSGTMYHRRSEIGKDGSRVSLRSPGMTVEHRGYPTSCFATKSSTASEKLSFASPATM